MVSEAAVCIGRGVGVTERMEWKVVAGNAAVGN